MMSKLLWTYVLAGLLMGATASSFVRQAASNGIPGGLIRPANVPSVPGNVQERTLTKIRAAASLNDGVFSDVLVAYLDAAESTDRDALVSSVQEALRKPLSSTTRTEIEALLGRLFELTPKDAMEVVEAVELPSALLSSVFRLWAEMDAQAAIALLDQIDEPFNERKLALAIVAVAGSEVIDAVVRQSRTLDVDGLAMAALVDGARKNPMGALQGLSALENKYAQAFAAADIGRIAGALDPSAALSAADSIADDRLKDLYVQEVYTQWGLSDLPQFLEHLLTLNPNRQDLVALVEDALGFAAESEPEFLLSLGRQVGGRLGAAAEAEALTALAGHDPASALTYLEAVPVGERRDHLTTSIATGYARHNLEAALNWAMSLEPPSLPVERAIMQALASTDLERAVRLELENPNKRAGSVVESPQIPAWFANRMISDFADPAGIAEGIVASVGSKLWKEGMVHATLSRWAITDSAGATAWAERNRTIVPAATLAMLVADRVPSLDVSAMISLGDSLPPEHRATWINEVVANAARSDPTLAMAVTERYRAEMYHEELVARVIGVVAITRGPQVAAQLLGAAPLPMAVLPVSRRWAQSDPGAAAAWALALPDQQARRAAVTEVVTTWADADLDAALRWAGSVADRSLTGEAIDTICQRFLKDGDCAR